MEDEVSTILRSGFTFYFNTHLSAISDLKTKSNSIIGNIQDSFNNEDTKEGVYSKDIERLYKIFSSGKSVYNLDFIDEVILTFNKLFYCNNLGSWFKSEINHGFCSTLHRDFIKDSIELFSNGCTDVNLDKYIGILEYIDNGKLYTTIDCPIDNVTNEVLLQNILKRIKNTTHINNIYGIEQFMIFLKVVFGK